ncbi:type IV secretion system protein [Xanthomonas citri]|uniref:type IV secretion system protein n=1 Tax=Xanthomonas citri TaxID=346 RepID=UPI000CCF4960|nr:type IV secretion system protein [Xanthomonas citri]PNV26472.1 type IV secretion system protein [Xanthomonas citri]
MKMKLLAGALAVALITPSVHAQMIVEDPGVLANTIQQISYMTQQLAEAKSQVEQLRQQYAALTGNSGMGALMPNSASTLRENLPEDWTKVYSDAMNSSSSITGSAQQLLGQFDSQISNMGRGDALTFIRKQMREKGAYDRVMAENAYNNQMRELQDIEALTRQIDRTTSMKQIADLQARIQTSNGAIQGEQAKLQLMSMLQQSQDRILQSQQEKAVRRYTIGEEGESFTAPRLSN